MYQSMRLTAAKPSPRPVSFHYPSPYRDENAEYATHLVQGEILLRRLVGAHAAGAHPAHRGLTLLHETLFWHRPASPPDPHLLAEFTRWFTRHGTPRPAPLTVAQLGTALIEHYGMGERMAAMLLTRQSHGLQVSEQAWLEQRRAMPVMQRPLLRAEYALLVDCVESAYRGQPVGNDRYANCGHASRAATLMGSLAVSPKAPFRYPALCAVFTHAFLRRGAPRAKCAG